MLTEVSLRSLKPLAKPYKAFDERGLYLLVVPSGGRPWRLKYRVAGREKLLALGSYSDVGLKRAREKRDEARKLVADGIDPSAKRHAEKTANANSFEAIGREWIELQLKKLSEKTFERNMRFLVEYLFPTLGRQPIAKIKAPECRLQPSLTHGGPAQDDAVVGGLSRWIAGRCERHADSARALTPRGKCLVSGLLLLPMENHQPAGVPQTRFTDTGHLDGRSRKRNAEGSGSATSPKKASEWRTGPAKATR
jgi:hypothetical protein